MPRKRTIERRKFLKLSAITAGGGTLVNTIGAPAILRNYNPSDIIGVGVIGTGNRARGLIREALNTPNIEFRGLCDVWDHRFGTGLELCQNPGAATYSDYRYLLDNKDIDTVIIGTPDHWHRRQVCDAAEAGKDVYSEKCMARSIEEGKAIRDCIRKTGRVYQLGHQLRSREVNFRAKEIVDSGALGKVTYVSLAHSRNKPVGRKRGWFVPGPEDFPAELTPDRLDWDNFLGDAPSRPWDPRRYLAWRCYWDYGTGLAGDMQSHVLDLTNQVLETGIPEKAYSTGQITYWNDGREVPDIWQSVFEWPSKGLIVIYCCNFTNGRQGASCKFYGSEATMDFYSDIKVYAEPRSDLYTEFFNKVKSGRIPYENTQTKAVPPVYDFEKTDYLSVADHMRDFFDCVRERRRTRCNEDVAFEEMATAAMSMASFQQKRQVSWDFVREKIV